MSQGEQTGNVFDASPMLGGDSAVGAGSNMFASLNENLFSCAYDKSDPSTSLAIMRGNPLQDAGFDVCNKVQDAAQHLVPTFGDMPIAQSQAEPEVQPVKSDSLDVACVSTLFKNDAGHTRMNALKNQAFDDLVRAA